MGHTTWAQFLCNVLYVPVLLVTYRHVLNERKERKEPKERMTMNTTRKKIKKLCSVDILVVTRKHYHNRKIFKREIE